MDTVRRGYQKSGDAQDLALYSQMRNAALANLDSLKTAVLLPSPRRDPPSRPGPAMDLPNRR